MTIYYRTQGFVFKKEDRSESNRIFSVFTKDFGRVEVVGRAIRKINSKLRSGMGIFSFSEIEFIQGRNKKTLTDAILINKFRSFAEQPEKLLLAQRISETVDSLIKGQEKDEKIFNLLDDALEKINGLQFSVPGFELLYSYFFWNLLSVLGYGPQLFNCAACHQKLQPYNLYFSNKEGGVICENCHKTKKDALEISSDVVKILRLMLKKDWQMLLKLKLGKNNQKLLQEVTERYCAYLKSNFQHE